MGHKEVGCNKCHYCLGSMNSHCDLLSNEVTFKLKCPRMSFTVTFLMYPAEICIQLFMVAILLIPLPSLQLLLEFIRDVSCWQWKEFDWQPHQPHGDFLCSRWTACPRHTVAGQKTPTDWKMSIKCHSYIKEDVGRHCTEKSGSV